MTEGIFTPLQNGIEDCPVHHRAYIQLFTQRLENVSQTKNLENLQKYLNGNGQGQIEGEENNTPLTKEDFINDLKEAFREDPEITGAIVDVENSLKQAR